MHTHNQRYLSVGSDYGKLELHLQFFLLFLDNFRFLSLQFCCQSQSETDIKLDLIGVPFLFVYMFVFKKSSKLLLSGAASRAVVVVVEVRGASTLLIRQLRQFISKSIHEKQDLKP